MKSLKNIYLLPEGFKNSFLFLSIAFTGFTLGIVVFYSRFFCPYMFIFLLFLPAFLYFLKENSIFFIIFYLIFFLCLGALRASFTINTGEGLIVGKGIIASFLKNSKYYKQAKVNIEEANIDVIGRVEGRFDLNEDVNVFDKIIFQGELKKPYRYKNIESETLFYENILENRRILKVNTLKIESKNKFFRWLIDIRKCLINQFNKNKGSGKKFFIEVLFGERVLDNDTRDIFSKTGTAHILSISGLHFTLTVFFAFVIAYIFNLIFPSSVDFLPRQVLVVVISIPFLIAYAFLSGLSVPAMRAFLFFAFSSFFMLFFKKHFNSFNLLFLVALIFIINDPLIITSKSFQLSFLSVFALLISFRYSSFLNNRLEKKLVLKILNYFIAMMFVSFVITLFILPILNSFSNQNLLASMLANPVVIPVFSLIILPFLFISLPFAFINEGIFNTILIIPDFGFRLILGYLEFLFHKMPEIYLSINFSILTLIFYYLTLLSLFLLSKKLKLLVVPLGIFLVFVFTKDPLKGPILVFPDVGQGDCAILKTEDEKVLFFDTGGNTWDESLGSRVYLPLMRKLGAKKVDLIILSHSHPDHTGMLDWLGKNFKIEKVLHSEDVIFSGKEVLINEGKCKINLLPGINSKNENNRSTWVLIEYKNYRILFTGDTEKDGIEKMVIKYNRLLKDKVTIIKVPHHGAKSSFREVLYKTLNPEYAIITVGEKNPWNLPSQEVLEYLRKRKIKYYRTDRDGEIIFNLNNGKVITYRNYYRF